MEHGEKQREKPVLVVDKDGVLGNRVAQVFAETNVTVLVSGMPPQKTNNLVVIPFKKTIPKIPNSAFGFMYLCYTENSPILDFLPNFTKKARGDKSHVFFVVNIRAVTDELLRKLATYQGVLTTIIIGDIMSAEPVWDNPVTAILNAAQKGMVIVPGFGNYQVYPVAEEDVLGVIHATAQQKAAAQSQIIYVLPSHPINAVSFTRLLLMTEPSLRIDFSSDSMPQLLASQVRTYQSVFGSNYPVSQKIPTWTISSTQESKKPKKVKRKPRPFPKIPGMGRGVVVTALALFTLILSPMICAVIGGGLLIQVQTNVRSGNMQTARSDAVAAKQFFMLAATSDRWLTAGLRSVGLYSLADRLQNTITTGGYVAQLGIDGIDGFTKLKRVVSGTSLDPKADFTQGLNSIKFAVRQLNTLEAEQRIPRQYQRQVSQLLQTTSPLINTTEVLPQLFGMSGKRTYLLLFQNNMELRPGGGFIGSYALITVDKGKLVNITIQDVYDADGQLRDHIEPPFALRRYLGSQHWFLRDSNFDLDFPSNAAMAGFFYNLEMGKRVDGVIAIDISFVRNVLRVIGPITIADYGQTVTADNFFHLTEEHAQKNFFPGSTQKKDFLSSVYNNVLIQLTQGKSLPYDKLVLVIGQNIKEKHLLVGFPDPSLQKLFSVNGFSSSLSDGREDRAGVINDFFGINEANLGQNKTNYYLNRSVIQKATIHEDGTASETATIQYQNSSTAASTFGGDYKAYVRLILPLNATFQSVFINGVATPTVDAVVNPSLYGSQLFRPPSQLEVEQGTENGKKILGFLIIVPSSTKKTITINYTLTPGRAATTPTLVYTNRLFKQPGTEADPYVLSVIHPEGFAVLGQGSEGKVSGNAVSFLSDIAQDREFSVTLTKQ